MWKSIFRLRTVLLRSIFKKKTLMLTEFGSFEIFNILMVFITTKNKICLHSHSLYTIKPAR